MEKIEDAVKKIRRSLNRRRADGEPDSWITLENGQHVPLDETGRAIGGAGGWAKGKIFSKAKTKTAKASAEQQKRMQGKLKEVLDGPGSKDDKYDTIRSIVKGCEVGSTFRIGNTTFTKMKDTDDEDDFSLAQNNADFANTSFRDAVHLMWYEYDENNDPPEFVDRDKKRAEIKSKIEGMRKAGEISGSDEVKRLEEGLISKNSPDFGKPGRYVMYRSGKLKKSGMVFFAPDKPGADTYASLHDDQTGQYAIDIKNPLVVSGSTDGQCLKMAWEALHPGQKMKGELTGSKWKKMDRENASGLKDSPYDAIIYKIGDEPHEIQIPGNRSKELEKLATYSTTSWSSIGHDLESAMYRDTFKNEPNDYKRLDGREDAEDNDPYDNESFRYFLCDWMRERHTDEEEWKTIKGTHVLIDTDTGDISKGPEGLKKWSSEKKPGSKGPGSFSSGPPTAESISESMKPKSTEYDFDLDDDMDDFMRKNAGNRRRPTPLYMLYNETENNGGDGWSAIEDEFFKTRLSKCTEGLKEISKDEAEEILYDSLRPGTLQAWFREYNQEVKPGLLWQMTSSPEAHNAALNQMYTNYKYQCQSDGTDPLPFEEFLVTPIKMYRGGTGKEYDEPSVFSSYTFSRKVAESFTGSEVGQGAEYDPNGVVYEAMIRPIDTYGSVYTNGESEILVPRTIAPNKNRDSVDEDGGALSLGDGVPVLEEEAVILVGTGIPDSQEGYAPEMYSADELAAMFGVYGNEYTEGKFIDIASRHDTIRLKGKTIHGDKKPEKWITLENGQHVPLDKSGKAMGGAGGWAKGKDFSQAESGNGKKKSAKSSGTAKKPATIVVKPLKKKPKGQEATAGTTSKAVKDPPGVEKAGGTSSKPAEKSAGQKKPVENNSKPAEKAGKTPEKGTVENPSAKGENVPCTGMKSGWRSSEHEKHYPEFGVKTKEEYEKMAIDFIKQPVGGDIDGYLRKPKPGSDQKPVVVRFNRKTGEIGMGIPGSFFLSYYKAKYDKLTGKVDIELANKYFDRLMKREGS